MPYDQVLGAGRTPRYAGTPSNAQISQSVAWNTTTDTYTASISSQTMIYGIAVSITPRDSNATTGTATRPQLSIFVDNSLVATYTLPPEGSDASEWNVQDIVPYTKEIVGDGVLLKVTTIATAVGGNGYACNFVITALGVQI